MRKSYYEMSDNELIAELPKAYRYYSDNEQLWNNYGRSTTRALYDLGCILVMLRTKHQGEWMTFLEHHHIDKHVWDNARDMAEAFQSPSEFADLNKTEAVAKAKVLLGKFPKSGNPAPSIIPSPAPSNNSVTGSSINLSSLTDTLGAPLLASQPASNSISSAGSNACPPEPSVETELKISPPVATDTSVAEAPPENGNADDSEDDDDEMLEGLQRVLNKMEDLATYECLPVHLVEQIANICERIIECAHQIRQLPSKDDAATLEYEEV